MNELNFALSKAKGQSAGPDEISYPILKHLPFEGKVALLKGLNKEWTAGTLPSSWKTAFVIPIPKNTKSAHDVEHYRPIALTSCLAKIMERLVNRRLMEHLDNSRYLDPRQHAFRAGFGTGTYFAALGQVLNDAL